ncbi:MAG: gamma-glutamylcyclotransferase family protein [Xanthomonadales bacterium]|nr:gamma-glutamylcyclotransferase family protein [Xanthomonadales bacterium]
MLYFAYGSNLCPHRLSNRIGPVAEVGTGVAPGFHLTFSKYGMDGSGKCHLVRSDRSAYGAVFELSPDQFRALDRIEGPGYRRRPIRVGTPGGDLSCVTYLARRHWIQYDLRPADWYRDMVLVGAYFIGAPQSYIRRIRSWPCRRELKRNSWDAIRWDIQYPFYSMDYDDWVPF